MRAFARSIAPYLRSRIGQGLLIVLTLVPTIAFTTIQPLLLKSLVDDAILPKNARLAAWLVGALALLLIADALGELANRTLMSRLGISICNDIRLGCRRRPPPPPRFLALYGARNDMRATVSIAIATSAAP